MEAIIYTDRDCDMALIEQKNIAIIGYGSQGRAHALNLRDSGVKNLKIGLRAESKSAEKVRAAGIEVASIEDCAKWADVLMMLIPDEDQAGLYNHTIKPHMKPGATLAFAHGFNMHFGFITPRADSDVWMIAPKEIGPMVRATYEAGGGAPALLAIAQDVSGQAKPLALSYAAAIGAGRSGILETSFAHECEVDLFGEQAVLFGGLPPLIRAAFETLIEGGYSAEMAYFKCVQQVKLVADAIYHHGISGMNKYISNTAEYGGYIAQDLLITDTLKQEMKGLLSDIQSGDFARAFMADRAPKGAHQLEKYRQQNAEHAMEKTGADIRKLVGCKNP
jgi:ketol-acid reductoisomerase